MESRTMLAAGGGLTASGLTGEYFANNSLSGSPTFTRQDVRVDFDWAARAPGGSVAAPYKDVPADNFSARWTGQFVPAFSEAYTFQTTADDGIRLYYRPVGGAWTTLIDNWPTSPQSPVDRTGTTAVLTAGQAYDIRLEYRELSGNATMKLKWSSASTPLEVVDPLRGLSLGLTGHSDSNVDKPFVDVWKTARLEKQADGSYRYEAPTSGPQQGIVAPLDAQGWPMGDFRAILWDGSFLTGDQHGTYTVSFTGKAGAMSVQGVNYTPGTLVYDPATNTTTGSFTINNVNGTNTGGIPKLQLTDTWRDNAMTQRGVTNLKVIRPGYTAQNTFTQGIKDLASEYSVLRMMGWSGINSNMQVNWADRTLPADNQTRRFNDKNAGVAWEYAIQFANETGKDLWLCIPAMATGSDPADTSSYIYKLADLIKNGGTVGGVTYPGLNPNLRVYLEFSNEVWNTLGSFQQSTQNKNAAIDEVNAGGSPLNYDSNTSSTIWARRRVAKRIKEISDVFRGVLGSGAMMTRIRPVYEWQYDNQNATAEDGLEFLNNYYNNADGTQHVADPTPPNYYLYGGGDAVYFTGDNEEGVQTAINAANPSFESPALAAGTFQQAPAGSSWTFGGTAGIASNGSTLNNPNANTGNGTQVAYVKGTGSISQMVNFSAPGTYSLYFVATQQPNVGEPQKLTFLFDNTPVGKDLSPHGISSVTSTMGNMDTMDFTVTTAGNHEIKFVGNPDNGNLNAVAFLDNVLVRSEDAIFASPIPNTTSSPGHLNFEQKRQVSASWALAYGLKYTSYEGGWSFANTSGIQEKVSGVQAAAREDTRAIDATLRAYNQFAQSGGDLFSDFGSGNVRTSPWNRTNDISNLNTSMINAAIRGSNEPAPDPTTNAVTVTDSPVTLTPASLKVEHNSSTSGVLDVGDWVAWNLWIPAAGNYKFSINAGSGGLAQIIVDNQVYDTFASSASATRAPVTVQLSRGLHSLRVRSQNGTGSGTFTLNSAKVEPGSGPTIPGGTFQQDTGADGIVSIEAENYNANVSQGGNSWTAFTGVAGYSGAGALEASPNIGNTRSTDYATNAPRLDYSINFNKTGTHYVWVRMSSPSGTDDSIHVGLDGAAPITSQHMTGGSATAWSWERYTFNQGRALFDVAAPGGVHTLNVWMREDGVRIDKIVLTTNINYSPTGNGPAESPRTSGVLVSNVSATSGRTYTLDTSGIAVGKNVYTDRTYTYSSVPASVAGAQYIKTANDDKTSTATNLLSFDLGQAADVYVAYDIRATSLPDWLAGWTDTGENLVYGDTLRLYKKHFSAGTVWLGGNLAAGASGALTNYTVLIKP
jgi:hypothetical protein